MSQRGLDDSDTLTKWRNYEVVMVVADMEADKVADTVLILDWYGSWEWWYEQNDVIIACEEFQQLGSSHRQTWLSPCQFKLISIADLAVS